MAATQSEKRILATRYVDALLALALEAKAEDAVLADLQVLASAAKESEALARLLVNPTITVSDKVAAMEAVAAKGKAHALTSQFLVTLTKEGRLAILPLCAPVFERKLAEKRGEVKAVVTSAKALKKKQVTDIEKALKKALGREVAVTTQEDASLLGGVRIEVGSRMLDHSVAGKLERLRQSLAESPAGAA